ncbi:transcriptional regulator [Frankia sp. CNm7]|uniref:Transcriptional regulator n=1 Tax=Frankia nepalensis TaxID=1836974 RepID=A0A937R9B5_9ACTN|nr:transcriptional regulator [Frankia nepalensis]MBL7496959.1 transcriptional regulator [Frankia nepalensis]MBL7511340.1 transcriptional regulator [Frankia nepalensis]MBL7523897.1 transcriptional regulator [Frankia nepalensis]MBL7626107.1 transcriptional regulator [Frankia nepalensis]
MGVSKNVLRSVSVVVAGATVVGAAALPASAAVGSTAHKPAVVAQSSPARQQVRVDIAIAAASVPAGARAVLVRNVTTGAVVGVYPLTGGRVTHMTVTVPVGTTLDITALAAANANRPANLGTVRVVVGAKGSTAAGNTVTVTFRKGSKPLATPSAALGWQGAKVSVR